MTAIDEFLIYDDLRRRGVRLSLRQLKRLEDTGRFPKRVRLSWKSVAWVPAEIEEYFAEKLRERDAPPKAA